MVEYALNLNNIFSSLADQTRRDILSRVAKKELNISEIAKPYKLTFAAVSKHLLVLEKAKLITKHRKGRQQYVRLSPATLQNTLEYLRDCEAIWNEHFNSLDELLRKEKKQDLIHSHHPIT